MTKIECASSGGSRIFPRGVRQLPKVLLFFNFVSENCMKMKEFGLPGGRASLAPPLDPPMASFYLSFFSNSLTSNKKNVTILILFCSNCSKSYTDHTSVSTFFLVFRPHKILYSNLSCLFVDDHKMLLGDLPYLAKSAKSDDLRLIFWNPPSKCVQLYLLFAK